MESGASAAAVAKPLAPATPRGQNPGDQLLFVEQFAPSVPFKDSQFRMLDLFVGRVAVAALKALPAATNRPAIFR